MKLHTISRAGKAAVLALLLALPATALAGAVWLRAGLDPVEGQTGQGIAQYQVSAKRAHFNVAVNDIVGSLDVDVLINGEYLATIELDRFGGGMLDLDTENGDDVPDLNEGDVIDIADSDSGVSILEGAMRRVRGS